MTFAMRKPLLMIPGPTDSPPEVLRRCGLPTFPHYEGDFPAFYKQLVDKMKPIFGTTEGTVQIANGSGTTAVCMMLASILTPDDSVLVIHNGGFGDYAEANVRCLGVPCTVVKGEHGTVIDCAKVREEMRRGGHSFILVTHNESSTAVVNPLPPLGEIAREFGALLLVDSVSGVGGVVIDMAGSGADVVAGASQKCLELPPGLGLVAIGPRAWDHLWAMENRRVPYVLDIVRWQNSFETRGDWHPQLTTGATTLLYALDWMADRINEEGIANRQERFRAAGDYLKAGMVELGFGNPTDPRHASPVLSEFTMPEGILASAFRSWCVAERNTMIGGGMRVNAAGDGISFRVAHFGLAAERGRMDHMLGIAREFLTGRQP